LLYTFVFFFSFSCYVAHRALHSFPTRRSSDLDAGSAERREARFILGRRRVAGEPAVGRRGMGGRPPVQAPDRAADRPANRARARDRKSTRLNSSHSQISYAVFCLKKKKKTKKK